MSEIRVECLVCRYMTLDKRGLYEICPVCRWEDEGYPSDASVATFGPNGDLSLDEARLQFRERHSTQRPPDKYKHLADLSTPEASLLFQGLISDYERAVKNAKKLDTPDKWTLQSKRDMLERLIESLGDTVSQENKDKLHEFDALFKKIGADDDAFFFDKDAPRESWWFRLNQVA